MKHVAAFLFAVLCSAAIVTAAGSSGVAGQDDFIRDPALAAERLFNAWQARNPKGAGDFATDGAVKKLFSIPPRPMTFTHCQRTDVGEFQCVYRESKADFEVWFKVLGGASAGYHVESVSFSTN